MQRFAILGIGNELLRDDGVGVHALRHFETQYAAAGIECLDAGTVGLALMDRLSGLDGLIAVDAMRLGKVPGTVTLLENEHMDAHLRNHHGSVHELGLSDILDGLRLCDDLPPHRALVGIEPEAMDWGTEPTSVVQAAIPEATARIQAFVERWRAPLTIEGDA